MKNVQIYEKHCFVSEYCTIDKKLQPFPGRFLFSQYIKNKPDKYGMICVIWLSYVLHLHHAIYAGQFILPIGQYRQSNYTHDIIKILISSIKGTGWNMAKDNLFMSFLLACKLLQTHNILMTGTLRKHKPEIITKFSPNKSKNVKSSLFGFNKEKNDFDFIWSQKKKENIFLLCHGDAKIYPLSGKQKPEIITF